MIRLIAPQFFTIDLPGTLALLLFRAHLHYYKEKLGFECLGTWQDPLDLRQRGPRPARNSFPLRRAAYSQS
jgi:hypothetical protein